ncbi:hypothetical protein ACQP1K_03720 [Sphaerimonospora sp. CA-214678]|uniref:hypothetical protein n=1 Tax=Sphaerimonospora sp. CA-214678 TaxID=3240029 RepID=UPI003D9183B5
MIMLIWRTNDRPLGNAFYGVLVMRVLAFPLSLAAGSLGVLKDAITGEQQDGPVYAWDYAYGWDYVLLSWPGIVNAVVLALPADVAAYPFGGASHGLGPGCGSDRGGNADHLRWVGAGPAVRLAVPRVRVGYGHRTDRQA